jgi:hypothetical protein
VNSTALSSRGPLLEELVRLLVPLAAFAAMAGLSAHELDPGGAAEGGYLAVLAAGVLLAAAVLAPRPGLEPPAGAVLAAAAVWALPPGPARGAAVVVVLAASLAVAAVRRLAETLPDLPPAVAIPLAVGCQLLLRGELLLHPEPLARTLVALLALPVAGGIAASVLARRHGGERVLVAAGTALLVAPGWNVLTTLALVALAAGDLMTWPGLGRPAKLAALAVVLAPIAWRPAAGLAGLAIAAAGLSLAQPLAGLLVGVAGWAAVGFLHLAPDLADFPRASLALLLLPTVLWVEGWRSRETLVRLGLAVGLIAGQDLVPELSALAAPLALAALLLRRAGPAASLQRMWTGMLLAGTALLASYPWLRQDAVLAALRLGGLEPGLLAGGIAVAVFSVLAALGLWLQRRPGRGPYPAFLLAGLVFVALLLALPRPGVTLLPDETAIELDAARPVWETPLPPGPIAGVVVDSALADSAGLAGGTPAAVLHLTGPDGRTLSWTLRAGQETGEWAARRPDVAASARLRSPRAWISWIAGDFFAQRYRAVWAVGHPERFARLRIERAPGLPAEVSLALHQVEVRR